MLQLSWLLIQAANAATLTVAADGSGDFVAIQAAIDGANSGDTIAVSAGEYNLPFDFSGKDLTIQGSGQDATLIDGQGEVSPLVTATAGEHIRFANLTLSNSFHQGIVVDGGSLSAEDVRFDDMGSQEHFGGAILATEADLTLTACHFQDNYGYDGGAIHASGAMSLHIEDTEFEANRGYGYTERVIEYEYDEETGEEISSTTLVQERQGQGGAVHVTGTGTITVIDSHFVDNRSRWAGGAMAIRTFDGEVTISGTSFEANRSVSSAGGAIANWMHGEDVYDLEEFSEIFNTFVVDDCVFDSNLAQRGSGGGIYTEGDFSGPIQLQIKNTIFSYNEASSDGGAVWARRMYDEVLIDNSSFDLNKGRNGGALGFDQQILFTGTQLDISSNTASSSGGGIYATNAVMLLLVDAHVRGNRAKAGQGGGIFASGLADTYPAKMVRVSISDNSSHLEGGGVFVRSVANVTVEESLLEGNEAGSNSFGGGLYADDSAYVKIRNSTLRSNTAHYGGGAYINDNADGSDFFNNIFLDNDARTGGGFALCNSPFSLFYNNTVAGNRAMFESSGAAFYNSQVEFRNNIFAHNTGGAALHMYDLNSAFYAELSHNNFYGNTPADIGGDLEASVLDLGGNMAIDPEFAHYAPDMPGDEASLVLALTSPLIDAGDALILDWDGTDSDVGAYGGDYLIVNDHDDDGYLSNVDCNDQDPSVYPGAEEIWYDGRNSDCAYGSDYDADGDGVAHPSGGGTDCDDTDASKSAPGDCPPPPEEVTPDETPESTDEKAASSSTSGKVGCASLGARGPWPMMLSLSLIAVFRRQGRP